MGRLFEAFKDLGEVNRFAPKEIQGWHRRGLLAFTLTPPQWLPAEIAFTNLLNLCEKGNDTERFHFLHNRGVARQGLRKWEPAVDDLTRATKLRPKGPDAWRPWLTLGEIHRSQRRLPEALAAFNKAIELGGKDLNIRVQKASVLAESSRFEEAWDELKAVRKSDLKHLEALHLAAWTAQLLNLEGEAQQAAALLLKQANNSDFDRQRAIRAQWAHAGKADLQPLIDKLSGDAKKEEPNWRRFLGLALAQYRMGQHQQALASLDRGEKAFAQWRKLSSLGAPKQVAAKSAGAEATPADWLLRGLVLHRLGKQEEAQKWWTLAALELKSLAPFDKFNTRTPPEPSWEEFQENYPRWAWDQNFTHPDWDRWVLLRALWRESQRAQGEHIP
jgi:tetratricopeptide (TPR) repeat protein